MKKRKMKKKGRQILYFIPALILILFVSGHVFSQRNWNQRRSEEMAESDLPGQRIPLPNSKLNLKDIPYQIVYESYRETGGKDNWEICLIHADGSSFINLTNTPDIQEFYPHASPDGKKICYVAVEGDTRENRSRNIYVKDIHGGGITKIATNAYQPCWNSDGTQVAYLKGEYSRYSDSSWSNRGLEIYDLETKKVRQHPNPAIRMLFNLCWSPDGKWFTATSRNRSRKSGNIAFRADDATEMPLSIRGCRPDISPDGKRIAWNRSDHVLSTGRLDLSSPRNNVTDQQSVIACQPDSKVYHVDWSPDGKYLTFCYGPERGDQAVGRRAAGWNICVYDMEEGMWIQVTSDGQHNKEPDWVPLESMVSDKR